MGQVICLASRSLGPAGIRSRIVPCVLRHRCSRFAKRTQPSARSRRSSSANSSRSKATAKPMSPVCLDSAGKCIWYANGPDDYKLRSKGRTTVLQDSEVGNLVVGKFGHRLGEEFAFEFFRRLVRSRIGRIHQLGVDQPRMRERERLDFSPKRDNTEGTQKNEWPCLVRNDPQLTTKLVRERVDEDWQFQPSIKLLESLSSWPASYRPPN